MKVTPQTNEKPTPTIRVEGKTLVIEWNNKTARKRPNYISAVLMMLITSAVVTGMLWQLVQENLGFWFPCIVGALFLIVGVAFFIQSNSSKSIHFNRSVFRSNVSGPGRVFSWECHPDEIVRIEFKRGRNGHLLVEHGRSRTIASTTSDEFKEQILSAIRTHLELLGMKIKIYES